MKLNNISAKGIIINNYNEKFYEDDNIKVIEKLTDLKVIHKFKSIENKEIDNIKHEYDNLALDKILELFE